MQRPQPTRTPAAIAYGCLHSIKSGNRYAADGGKKTYVAVPPCLDADSHHGASNAFSDNDMPLSAPKVSPRRMVAEMFQITLFSSHPVALVIAYGLRDVVS